MQNAKGKMQSAECRESVFIAKKGYLKTKVFR